MASIKHRRNHVITALGLVISAALLVVGAFTSVITVDGPQASLDLTKRLGIGLDPSLSGGLDEVSKSLLFGAAAVVGFMGLLLLVTRVRFLGLLWRSLALLALVLPAYLAYAWWTFVSDPVSVADSESAGQVVGLVGGALDALGLIDVRAGTGLWAITAGTSIAVLACLIPAFRSSHVVDQGGGSGLAAPGWYPGRDDPRVVHYWDGRQWTGSRDTTR